VADETCKWKTDTSFFAMNPWSSDLEYLSYEKRKFEVVDANTVVNRFERECRTDNRILIEIRQAGEYTIVVPSCATIEHNGDLIPVGSASVGLFKSPLGYFFTKDSYSGESHLVKYVKEKDAPGVISQHIPFGKNGLIRVRQVGDAKLDIKVAVDVGEELVIRGPVLAEWKPSWETNNKELLAETKQELTKYSEILWKNEGMHSANQIVIELSVPGMYNIQIPEDADFEIDLFSLNANVNYLTRRASKLSVRSAGVNHAGDSGGSGGDTPYRSRWTYGGLCDTYNPIFPTTQIQTRGYVNIPSYNIPSWKEETTPGKQSEDFGNQKI
ncbi:MAG: hypothetical protein Harvfovirus52_8, partial [Harvfovirus sp.]